MFLGSPILVGIYLFAYALAGMTIGGITGLLVARMTRRGLRGFPKDIFLGSFGFLAGFIGCAFMPWPENTVVERVDGGGSVATTMNRYQHPEHVAIVLAILLPLLHELYRWKKRHVGQLL